MTYPRRTLIGSLVLAVMFAQAAYAQVKTVPATGVTGSGLVVGGTIYGSSAANGDLALEGTSSTTKTTSYVTMQATGGNVLIGSASPNPFRTDAALEVSRVNAPGGGTLLTAFDATKPGVSTTENALAFGAYTDAGTSAIKQMSISSKWADVTDAAYRAVLSFNLAWKSNEQIVLNMWGNTGAAWWPSQNTTGPGAHTMQLPSDGVLAWENVATPDLMLRKDAADTLAMRRATNPQSFRFYTTYTDGSNYEYGSLAATAGAVTLSAATAGTGSDNINVVLTPIGTGIVQSAKGFDVGGGTLDPPSLAHIGGVWNPAINDTVNGLLINPTVFAYAVKNSSVVNIAGTIAEAGSGTHARLMGLSITAPTISADAAAVADATTVYISGAPSATVTGALTALWVDAGNARFDGDVSAATFTAPGGAGIDKTCGGPVVSATFSKGILTAMTCTTEPQPTVPDLLQMINDLRAELAALKGRQ